MPIMAGTIQIQYVNKSDRSNPHERILCIGGTNPDGRRWKRRQEQVIADIEAGTYTYYVAVADGESVWVVVAVNPWGNKYLKTTADGEAPNNLLALPECP
jgi:hypothetical protein